MRRLGLIAAVVASALAGAVVAKLHTRWGAMCANVPCASLQIRLGVIEQMIAARPRGPTYLVIGDSLTEINVTSPTGFQEITEQTGFDVAAMFVAALERALA